MTIHPFLHGACGAAIVAAATCIAPGVVAEERTVTLSGAAEQSCTLGQPAADGGAQTNFDAPSGSIFGITALGDPVTLTTRAANITLAMAASCNSLHRVLLTSDGNGLWRIGATAPVSGFGSAVPYRANLVWADDQTSLDANADQRQAIEREMLVGHPSTGQMLLEFVISAGDTNVGAGAPLLAGEYSDVLRLTVEAQ